MRRREFLKKISKIVPIIVATPLVISEIIKERKNDNLINIRDKVTCDNKTISALKSGGCPVIDFGRNDINFELRKWSGGIEIKNKL